MKASLETTGMHLQAHLHCHMLGDKTPEITLEERLGGGVDLGRRFADLAGLYAKIHALLSGSNGTPPLDLVIATTHIAVELKQGQNVHRVVDAGKLGSEQTFYAGNVWIGPELAEYRTLDPADLPSSSGLPQLSEGDQERYRIMTGSSHANAIVHTISGKVITLHPLDMIVQQDGKEIIGRPVSLVVAERMEKFAAKMRGITRD